MHQVVLQLLADNQPIMATEPLVADAATIFKTIVAAITATNQHKQDTDTGGFTANKNNAIDVAFTLAAELSVKAKPYARKLGDAVLLKAINHSFSNLHDGPDTTGLAMCTSMVMALQPHLTTLLPYKITAASLVTLTTAIATATPKAAERDVVDVAHTNSTAQLLTLFKQAKTALIDLDDLVEGQLSANHKAFVDSYFIARRIIDMRGGRSGGAVVVPPKG